MINFIKFIKQFFCNHESYPFVALNDPDGKVCKKCGANY